MIRKRPVVGVFGTGTDECLELAQPLGETLARRGVHLLTGGGGGVMTSVSRSFSEVRGRAGQILGILPCDSQQPASPREGYPNDWVEIAIRTHLPLSGEQGTEFGSRNHINVLSSDLIIALPGGAGTRSELQLACRYHRPALVYLSPQTEFPELPPEIPVVRELSEVQAWLTDNLPEREEGLPSEEPSSWSDTSI